MKRVFLLAILLMYIAVPYGLCQQNIQNLLGQRVRGIYVTNKNLLYALSDLSENYDIPIGVEIYQENKKPIPENKLLAKVEELYKSLPEIKKSQYIEGKTVRESLDIITQINDDYTWIESDGVINVFPKGKETVLDAPIRYFKANGLTELGIKDAIVTLPTVKSKSATLGMELSWLYIGNLRNINSNSQIYTFELYDAKARDILNYVIKTGNKHFWYVYPTLGGNVSYIYIGYL